MISAAPGGTLGGRYRLVKEIGHGAFGEVWEAWDTNRSHSVALKLLVRGHTADAWVEASLLTQLKSPYILEVNNADVIVDVPFLDTALARDSLDRASSPRGMEPHLAVESIRRVLRGLSLCHSRGLVHRDVKPANIFVKANGDIVLGDFGAAKLMDDSGLVSCGGDPRVRAPEAISTGKQGAPADIYGAAVALYSVLTGRWPFDQQLQIDLNEAIVSGTRPPLRELAPHVSRSLAAVVDRALHVDPAARYATAAAFDSALGSLPVRTNRFTPLSEHAGHERCWSVEGKSSLYVCLVKDAGTRVEVTHKKSGRRVGRYGGDCAAPKVGPVLRKTFDELRNQ